MDLATEVGVGERPAVAHSTAWRHAGAVLSAGGLLLAIAGETWHRETGIPDPLIVPAAVAVLVGLLVSWHAAVDRVSGPPTVWFTAAIPAVAAVAATAVEAAHAYGVAFDTSAISLLLVPVAVCVTLVGGHASRRRWRTGLLAWSMALFHLGMSVGALAGIPLGTFGDATRSDELLVWGAVLPLVAIAVALALAPRTSWRVRLAGPVLVAAVAPASVATGTLVAGLAVITLLSVSIVTVGTARTSEDHEGAA